MQAKIIENTTSSAREPRLFGEKHLLKVYDKLVKALPKLGATVHAPQLILALDEASCLYNQRHGYVPPHILYRAISCFSNRTQSPL